MKELTNKNIYEFLAAEIALHPELDDMFRCDLREQEHDEMFWEELLDEFSAMGDDCFTICDVCGKPMIEGYVMGGSHYCSEACLHADYTEEEVVRLCADDNDECYYTTWYEDSIIYKEGIFKQ